ncbi:peroxide stress protein YaaA [Crocosphaera sp. UHCC 0190]|uniref:peroxide stress protein YaaA n=1 Tax=Crocosphaera sp. UHCC 0190 TaxID=3110246 RepID=UPI002B2206A8|nr:peroxide stress protein YaaA [Crocosphaera sp. UHCC 0190]MEA5508145.1 peroxide stress protein YaaA [Crocosphaera sp. UHCC 0190]
MISILSSAKTLAFDDSLEVPPITKPIFQEYGQFLVKSLQQLSVEQLEKLLGVSETLANLNYQRFQEFNDSQKRAAILAYRGDVFKQLEIDKFNDDDYLFAQEHLRIISGLYGILRPLDEIKPYRLEMNTNFHVEKNTNLYGFWTTKITEKLNYELAKHQKQVLLNLASDEYSRVIKRQNFNYPILKISFKEMREGKLKTIGLIAKKNRGVMTNWIIRHKIDDPEQLKEYSWSGYSYYESLSNEQEFVFLKQG